jgi:hypothetical protein
MSGSIAFGVALLLAGRVPAREPSPYALFERDKRLDRAITLLQATPPKKLTLGDLLEELSRQLEVDLAVQGSRFTREINPDEFRDRTGREILAGIGLTLEARWKEHKGVYLLVPVSRQERTATLRRRAAEEPRVQRALVASFSRWQRTELIEKRRLTFEQLNPQQQQLFLRALQWASPDFAGLIPESSFTGRGGEIRLSPVINADDPSTTTPFAWEVGLMVPIRGPNGEEPFPQPFAMLPPDMSPGLAGKNPN